MRRFHGTLELIVATLLVVAMLTVSVPAAAQTTAPVSLGQIQAPNPYTVDAGHSLSITVSNTGQVPVQGTIVFYHSSVAENNQVGTPQEFTVAPGDTATVSQSWNAKPGGNPITDTRDVFAHLEEVNAPFQVPDEDTRQKTLTFHYHDLDIAAEDPEIPSAKPGDLVEQHFLVTNLGNVKEDVATALQDPTAGWSFQLDDDLLQAINPGASRTVVLTGIAPGGADAGSEGTATVTATSTAFTQATSSAISHAFTVETDQDFLFSAPSTPINVDPGDLVSFEVGATNTGNAPVALDLQAVVPAGFPTVSFDPDQLSLDPGDGKTSAVSAQTTDDTPAGDYELTIRASPSSDGSDPQEAVVAVVVAQEYGLDLTFPSDQPDHEDVEPSQTGTFALHLTNTGNGPDQYAIDAIDLPDGWGFERTLTDEDTVVGAGVQIDVEIAIDVPPGTPPGPYPFSLEAQSLGDPTVTGALDVRVDVPDVPVPSATPDLPVKPVVAEQTVDFTITLENVGNQADTFQLLDPTIEEAVPEHEAWTATWSESEVTLDAGDSEDVTVTVTSPPEEDVTISSKVRFLLTVEAVSNQRADTTTIEAQIAAPDLIIDAIEAPTKVYAGAASTIDVTIANVGTQDLPEAADVKIEILREGHTGSEHVAWVTVDELPWQPGGDANKATRSFTWTPKFGDEYTVRATADPNNTIEEKADETTPSFDNNGLEEPATSRTFDATITPPLTTSVLPGQELLLDADTAFVIRNTGSHTETFHLTAATGHEWGLSLQLEEIELAPQSTRTLPITVHVPLAPGRLQETVTLTADGDGPATFEAAALLKVVDEDAPDIDDVTVDPTDPAPGQTFNVTAVITDATQVAQARAAIVAPNGVRTVLAMDQDPDDPDVWTLSHALAEPGRYAVSVTASDIVEPPNTASTQSSPTAVTVTASGAPTITFLLPEVGATVRGTNAVSFTVNDNAGIQKVWYEAYRLNQSAYDEVMDGAPVIIDPEPELLLLPLELEQQPVLLNPANATVNRTLAIGNPYAASLSGVPDGHSLLVVYANNVYQAGASKLLPVRVDNTPPKILKVQPIAQDASKLRIQASVEPPEDVAAVELVATLSDNTVQRVPFKATEDENRHEVDASFAKNIRSWRVVAWDHVGNSAVYEANAAGSAQEQGAGGSSPAPSLLLLLAAFALTAAVHRTRRRGT